jgi:hypothetical protein
MEKETYASYLECFFRQFMAFCEFMNDSEGKIETEKYANHFLYSYQKRLEVQMDEKGIKYVKQLYTESDV